MFKPLFFILTLLCTGMLSLAYILQYGFNLEPCPLCVLERFVLFIMLGSCILGLMIKNKIIQKILYYLIIINNFLALAIAGRHLYLQSLPPEKVPACAPGFDFLINNFSASEVLSILLKGSGQCANIGPRFLYLSVAQWSFIGFSFLMLLSLSAKIWTKKLSRP